MKLKVAIINLTGGGLCEGYRKYLVNVIPLLARHPEIDSLLCVAPNSWQISTWFPPQKNLRFVSGPNFRIFLQCDRKLREQLESFCPDVIFVPVERPFNFKSFPVVTMPQNMGFAVTHRSLFLKVKTKIQYFVTRLAVTRSNRVVAISRFVHDFLVGQWNVSPDKIAVIYHGVQQGQPSQGIRPEAISENMANRFLFTAGSIWPARGLEDLILASRGIDFDSWGLKGIVVAGETVPGMARYQQEMVGSLKRNDLLSRFIFLGKINAPEMQWCYRNCRALIMTSRVEACPNIALEAMANGCLSVAADNPPLPEIFKDCAIYYQPRDSVGLLKAIHAILKWSDEEKVAMSRKARNRACEFSWERTTNELIRELRHAVQISVGGLSKISS